MVQLQKGQPIQLATNGSAPEFPEGPAKDSQLLLSATFLTAELALLQKSLEVKLKDKRVSCHHTPLASAPRVPGSACPGHLGVVQESDAGDVGLLGVSMAVTPAYHSLLCPCDLCLSTCLSNLPYTLHFFSSKLKKKVYNVEVRRQLSGVGSLLPLGAPGPGIRSRLVQQEILPAEPSLPRPHISQALEAVSFLLPKASPIHCVFTT